MRLISSAGAHMLFAAHEDPGKRESWSVIEPLKKNAHALKEEKEAIIRSPKKATKSEGPRQGISLAEEQTKKPQKRLKGEHTMTE